MYCDVQINAFFMHAVIMHTIVNNENIYFEDYYDEQRKFTDESYSI